MGYIYSWEERNGGWVIGKCVPGEKVQKQEARGKFLCLWVEDVKMSQDAGIRQLLRKHLPDGDWNSVETGATAGGVPDSNYCFSGGLEGWVEGKRTLAWKVTFRPLQIGWLSRRSRHGGRCFVMVRRLNGGLDQCYLFPGARAEEFDRQGCTLKGWSCPSWGGGPAAWDWEEIRRILTA